MIVMGITLFDYGKFKLITDTFVKSNFPTDSDGKLCGVDAAGYNYVYFADAPNFVLIQSYAGSKSLCVCLSRWY